MASTPQVAALDGKDAQIKARFQRRVELRKLNLAAWDGNDVEEASGKLDTSLKRHTALLNRLKTSLSVSTGISSIIKEISSLSLEKYVEELVGATMEGLGKCKTGTEINGAVEVISILHCRFPKLYTVPLIGQLTQALKPSTSNATEKDIKEKEDSARIIRQRGFLRIMGELEAVGVVRKYDSKESATGEMIFNALRDLLKAEKDSLSLTAPLPIAFVKHLGDIYLPSMFNTASNVNGQDSASESPTALSTESTNLSPQSDDAIVPTVVKDKFKKLMMSYLEALVKRESKLHVDLQRQDKRNHEAYVRSGEMFEDREKVYEKAVKAWERGWANVTQLSELLGEPVPSLPSTSSALVAGSSIVTGSTSTFANDEVGGPNSIWLDEEEKNFYEDLRELKTEVPASILGVRAPRADVAESSTTPNSSTENDEDKYENLPQNELKGPGNSHIPDEEVNDIVSELSDPVAALSLDGPDATIPAGPAAQLTAIFARLPEASSRATVDAIAIEFAFLNSKAARKRLVKFLGSVSRNRQDLLPYYARLVATLDPYMPDVGKELVEILENEFRYFQKRKNADMAENRSKNLRFLSELTKFGVTRPHIIWFIYKVLLDDFSGPNIDNFCTLLEGCGRYLLRTTASSDKMAAILATMQRKKAAMNLDQRQVTMLENAYYQCNPPDRPAMPPKQRTPMQLFLRHLFYHQLTRNSVEKVLKLVRKLHWEDPAIVKKLHSAFTKVWKIKYSNIHLFAVLLYDLGKFHPNFSVSVVDQVLEDTRVGMEINSFKYNQQRVATVKYLGELYNYRVIESRIVFDTLWSLVTFGHPEGRPHPDAATPIDSPDDCFRIRLVCTLLDTCGTCFSTKQLKKRLDNFLLFFQMYTFTKSQPLPMDVDFMLTDTYELLRRKNDAYKSFYEAAVAVDEMSAREGANDHVEEDEAEDGVNDVRRGTLDNVDGAEDDGAEEEDVGDKDGDDTDESSTAKEGSDSSNSDEDEDGDEDEINAERRSKDPNAMTEDQEDEFNRELAKMMANVGEAGRKAPERKQLDVAVPLVRKAGATSSGVVEDDMEDVAHESGKGMRFTMLTKKGNKQQTITMEIPRESSIALHTLEKQARDQAEKQQLKRLVLDYEQREEVAEKQALKDTMSRRGVNLRFVQPKNG